MNGINNKSIIIFIQQCQRKTQLSPILIKCIVFTRPISDKRIPYSYIKYEYPFYFSLYLP